MILEPFLITGGYLSHLYYPTHLFGSTDVKEFGMMYCASGKWTAARRNKKQTK